MVMIIQSIYWSLSGVFQKVLNMTLASFKTVFQKHPKKDRTWVILLIAIFIFPMDILQDILPADATAFTSPNTVNTIQTGSRDLTLKHYF